MSDRFGLVHLPASERDEPVGDPALARLGDFLRAVMNAEADKAWAAAQPAPSGSDRPVVKTVLLHDPSLRAFNVEALPALFAWRHKGTHERLAEQWYTETPQVRALWILPALPQEEQRARDTFWQVLEKAVGAALERGRHVAWVDAEDDDPLSASVAASDDALALVRATSTNPVTLSGASLDGAVGTKLLRPRREPTVTTAASPGAYTTSQPIRFECVDWRGDTVKRSRKLANPDGGETLRLGEDVARVLSVRIPGMLKPSGRLSVGLGAFGGRGSEILTRARLERVRLVEWQVVNVDGGSRARAHNRRHALDGDQGATERLPFFGLEMSLEMRELYEPDRSSLSRVDVTNPTGPGVDTDFARPDGVSVTRASFPDRS